MAWLWHLFSPETEWHVSNHISKNQEELWLLSHIVGSPLKRGVITDISLVVSVRSTETTDKRTDVWSRDFMIWEINLGFGLDCGIKATFEARFSNSLGSKKIYKFFWKHHSVRTEKLHKKTGKKPYFGGRRIYFQKNHFFRAKNATVKTGRPKSPQLYIQDF